MAGLGLHYVGSLQRGAHIHSENPLETIWGFIALLGTPDYLATHLRFDEGSGIDRDKLAQYIAARAQQSVEFRGGFRQASLLTSPLPLYYALLNLTRAVIAAESGLIAPPSHGLRLRSATTLTLSEAEVGDDGTFPLLLRQLGSKSPKGTRVTLEECIGALPELSEGPYHNVRFGMGRAIPIRVKAVIHGGITLHFNRIEGDWFREEWRAEFPSLADICSLAPEGNILIVNDGAYPTGPQDFCSKHLMPSVYPLSSATWYLYRNADGSALPRPAYYYAATFILGSIVRYQPELLLAALAPPSQDAWLARATLSACERCFPNLLWNWLAGAPFYIGSS